MEVQQKHNILGDIRILLGKDCEVKKIMWFLKGIGMFEKNRLDGRPTRSVH